MHLSPKETDRLLLFLAAELARRRRSRGLRLNYPEACAFIADEILEGARDGRSVSELMEFGGTLLSTDDVLPGVAKLVGTLQVEGMFPDGQKLVTIHDPIRAGETPAEGVDPGEVIVGDGDIELTPGRRRDALTVTNTGDRPIQVGSHFHFVEVNRALRFDRARSLGMRLDIPAGTAVRFEPGEDRDVTLVALGGRRFAAGLNLVARGQIDDPAVRDDAFRRLREAGFLESDKGDR